MILDAKILTLDGDINALALKMRIFACKMSIFASDRLISRLKIMISGREIVISCLKIMISCPKIMISELKVLDLASKAHDFVSKWTPVASRESLSCAALDGLASKKRGLRRFQQPAAPFQLGTASKAVGASSCQVSSSRSSSYRFHIGIDQPEEESAANSLAAGLGGDKAVWCPEGIGRYERMDARSGH